VTRLLAILAGLLLLALLALGWFSYSQHVSLHEKDVQLGALADDLKQSRRIGEVDRIALQGRLVAATHNLSTMKELQRAVPAQVPDGTPALPPGWRVLHDAAAEGVQLPDPASSAPAAPVAAAEAAATVIRNYGSCRDQDDAYQRLQQWLQGVKKP
jgi:hypothetical protein